MKARPLLSLAAFSAASAFAGYQYDFAGLLNPYSASQWTANGVYSASNNMFTSSDGAGGSLILNSAVPGSGNTYEVRTTLTLNSSGGYYVTLLRATSNSLVVNGNTGTWYAVEIANPTFSGNSCSTGLNILKSVAGSISLVGSGSGPCHNGMVVRVVMLPGSLWIYIDNVWWLNYFDSSITAGQPGIDVALAPAGNGISAVDIGHQDTVAPSAVNAQTIGTSSFSNRVDLQWQGVADDANGTGVAFYYVYRDGVWLDFIRTSVFSDAAATAGSHTYTLQAFDYHDNASPPTTINVTVPSGAIDPRQVGVRPLGTYWGYGGEQIDMRSGNLNYSVPLVKAIGRGGWGVSFNLTYNSQNWRQDPGGIWQLGRDVGYGYGWRLLAGSLLPVYQDYWTIHHYLFTDSSGAEYRLDQNNGGVWSSKESVYVYYDSNAGRLYFRDGSFWLLGCTSAATEQDGGTMYPTTMEDTNGNQVTVTYNAGAGVTWTNSSARINQINDVRQTYYAGNVVLTYAFSYTTDPVLPHLTTIANAIHTAESYSFNIPSSQPLKNPFTLTSFGTTSLLQSLTQTGTSLTTGFIYDSAGSGELTQMNTPYGGHIRWFYSPLTYAGSRTQREVSTRYLLKAFGATETAYSLAHDPSDSSRTVHNYTILDDPDTHSEKQWNFQTDPAQPNVGLIVSHQARLQPGVTTGQHQESYTLATDPAGNPYISAVLITEDTGNAAQVQKKTTQTLDQYGNLTQMQVYDYGLAGQPPQATAARTYTNTYLTDANYTSRYIHNRLLTSTVTDSSNRTGTLVSNQYDLPSGNLPATCNVSGIPSTWLSDQPLITQHDSAYNINFTYRGNLVIGTVPGATACSFYDIGGNALATVKNGVLISGGITSATNYALPSTLTSNGTTTLSWTSFLGLSSVSGPNGDSASMGYDANARPSSSSSPFGVSTTYTYNDTASPPTKTATTNGRWVRTTMDGFGRTIKTESGDGSSTKSVVDTIYDSCGCSPIGKMKQVSLPYAPGGTPVYTTYTYDGLGRTVTAVAADGSTTAYSYVGNSVKVTDPAGKWKQFFMDGMGNLTYVAEPDPALGTVYTQYVYDVLNHLTQVYMTRGSTLQTRVFNYTIGNTVGAVLLSATNPENGTVNYTYNSDYTLATKTDAKGQQFSYAYDYYKRLLTVSSSGGVALHTYYYDTNPFNSTFSQYALGRLTAVQHASFTGYFANDLSTFTNQFTEMYSYTRPGQISTKRLQLAKTQPNSNETQQVMVTASIDTAFSYNNEGKLTNVTYPSTNYGQPSYSYTYDTMMRPSGMTDQTNSSIVSSTQYGAANELLQITISGRGTETRQYNNLYQLTNISVPGITNISYAFTVGSNNGKISSQTDAITGETVNYQYDSLNRLISASSSGWSQGYGYDGFGSLTSRSGTNAINTPADAYNRLSGYNYDANGNLLSTGYAYDPENHLIQANAGAIQYSYDSQNKRVWQGNFTQQGLGSLWVLNSENVNIYGVDGKLLGSYVPQVAYDGSGNPSSLSFTSPTTRAYFASRLVSIQSWGNPGSNQLTSGPDRLNSNGKFYPYGETKVAVSPPQIAMFATYTRDATGIDYADQRYYSSQFGRFLTPDPYGGSARKSDPQSWNRYSYVGGDPANRNDPSGLDGDDESNPASGCYFNGVWVSGCDVGFGITRFAPQTAFTRAVDRLNAAIDALEDRSNISGNCQIDLNALSRATGQTIDLGAIQDALANTDFKNGVGSTLPISALGGPGAEAYGAALQADRNAKYGPGQTIGNDFARNPNGLAAETVLLGRTIFINPLLIGGSLSSNEGLLFHEALHELGLIDSTIQEALGLTVDDRNTKNITNKLQKDCINGKGNN